MTVPQVGAHRFPQLLQFGRILPLIMPVFELLILVGGHQVNNLLVFVEELENFWIMKIVMQVSAIDAHCLGEVRPRKNVRHRGNAAIR